MSRQAVPLVIRPDTPAGAKVCAPTRSDWCCGLLGLERQAVCSCTLPQASCSPPPHVCSVSPPSPQAMQKLSRTAPRLVVAADKATPELVKQLQELSKSKEDLAVVLATEHVGATCLQA